MSRASSVAVKIFKKKSPEILEQAINDHFKLFDGNPLQTTVNIQYVIAEETVLDNNDNPKKELIYSALLHITVNE